MDNFDDQQKIGGLWDFSIFNKESKKQLSRITSGRCVMIIFLCIEFNLYDCNMKYHHPSHTADLEYTKLDSIIFLGLADQQSTKPNS